MAENTRDDGGGRRGRKRAATRVAITDAARSLTAAHGVNGFTIEQLCEDVGISRRTFFNYFPGKEDAILGDPMDHIPEALARVFVEGGAGFPADEISPTMLPDFIELACAMMDRLAMSRDDVVRLREAITAEPKLLDKAVHGSQKAEEAFAQLLAARERLLPQDLRIRLAVGVMTAISKQAGEEFFAPWNTRSYRDVLTDAVDAVRAIIHPAAHTTTT